LEKKNGDSIQGTVERSTQKGPLIKRIGVRKEKEKKRKQDTHKRVDEGREKFLVLPTSSANRSEEMAVGGKNSEGKK